MKHFIKVFSIAFVCFALAITAGVFTYLKFANNEVNANDNKNNSQNEEELDNEDDEKDDIKDPLQKAISKSKRINVLLLGLEGPRTDTIIFTSFDPVTKKVDMISIPRDTYFYRKGFEESDKRKINAVYGDAGPKGTMDAVENILGGVPVHHYVSVSYTGVEKIVDSLGGVEVNVPFHMQYKDPTANPPLYIDVPAGKQVLNGDKAVEFLRYRQSNDGKVGYPDGDLGRIRAQQQFLKSAFKKALSFRLPAVINTCYRYVKTDISLQEAIIYVKDAIGINLDDFSMTILPGVGKYKNGVSYYFHDPQQIRELMVKLYGVEEEKADSSNE